MSDTGKTIALIKALAPAPEIDPAIIEQSVDNWLDDHPEATTTVEDGSITMAKLDADLQAEIEKKADNDGLYEQMTVGNAEQLVATVGVEDKAPYNFRTAGGSADIGDRETDMIVGGTVVWNQLYPTSATASAYGLTTNTVNGKLTISGTTNSTGSHEWVLLTTYKSIPSGHKVFVSAAPSPFRYRLPGATYTVVGKPAIFSVGANATNQLVLSLDPMTSGDEYNLTAYPQVIDLTQMFGSTIADYIYNLETATPGAGVAWFRKLFPKDYYAYNPGELMSVKAAAHKMRGFNAWDEEWEVGTFNTTTGVNVAVSNQIRTKNKIPIIGGASYFFSAPPNYAWFIFFDAEGNVLTDAYISDSRSGNSSSIYSGASFTAPNNARYMRFYLLTGYGDTYKNDICINLSWDGERDGEYEAYDEHVYPLDDSLTLRGIPKLDANNNLYYDGDTYESDGTVTRKYFELTLTGDETYNVYSSSYIKSDACDASIAVTTKNVPNYETNQHAVCNQLIGAKNQGLWELEGHAGEFTLNGGTQLHINIANTTLGITDYTQETTTTVATKIKAYVKALYDAGTPLKFTLPIATPTTETADAYQNPQIVDDFGTEEYIDAGVTASTPTRDVAIPVGHETTYQANLRAKLEMAPESPDGDGDYIVRQTNGQNEYVELVIPTELPTAPTTDGNYVLKCTVSNGTATFAWEVQS